MIRAILVDDEKTCLQSLQRSLLELGEVQVLASCRTIEEAEQALGQQQTDLLFLDVELQDRSGFELLAGLGTRKIDVIFTTAHDQYALRAIKASAQTLPSHDHVGVPPEPLSGATVQLQWHIKS